MGVVRRCGTWDGAACRLRVLRTRSRSPGRCGPTRPPRRSASCAPWWSRSSTRSCSRRSTQSGQVKAAPAAALRPHDAVLRDGEVRRHRLGAGGRGHPDEDPLAGGRHRPRHRARVRRQRPRLAAVDPPHRVALDPLHLRGVRPRASSRAHEEEQYWEECARAAEFQTIDPADVPRTREGIRAYFEAYRPRLIASEVAQGMMDFLLDADAIVLPPELPAPLRRLFTAVDPARRHRHAAPVDAPPRRDAASRPSSTPSRSR